MKKNDVERYFQYESIIELYTQYKIDFFELIDKNLANWTASNLLKEYYNNYEFDKVRILLDDRVDTWDRMCKNFVSEGDSIKECYDEYKAWKEVENSFLTFIDIYDEKIENDLTV